MTTRRTILKAIRVRDASGTFCVAYQERTPVTQQMLSWFDRICMVWTLLFVFVIVPFAVASAMQWI